MKVFIFFILSFLSAFTFAAKFPLPNGRGSVSTLPSEPRPLGSGNFRGAALKRGAQTFMNDCSGCHSLQYLRHDHFFHSLRLSQKNAPYQTSLPKKDAIQWFGIVPPDLSLIAKKRGQSWLTEYLTAFYPDPHQRFGENNFLMPNLTMPNPFSGDVSRSTVHDLVIFLNYASDPSMILRYKLGPWVLLMGLVLCVLLYRLKKLYWKKTDTTH